MDQFNFKNMLLAYNAVHDDVLCESMDELGFFDDGYDYMLNEVEGSYGQTPRAKRAFEDLYKKRFNTDTKHFRGGKSGKLKSVFDVQAHINRIGNPDVGHTGRISPRPDEYSHRRGMTQADRDDARQQSTYYRSQSDDTRGSLPKGKKLTRQRKTGVSAESYDVYDIILSHLLDEGYADCLGSAEVILENMSEGWIENIMEVIGKGVIDPETGRGTRLLVRPDGSIIEPGTRVMRRSPQQKLSAKLLKLQGSRINKDGTKNTKIEKRIMGLHKGSHRLRELSRLTNLGKIIGGPGKRIP